MNQFNQIHAQYTKVRPAYPPQVYDEIAADLKAVPVDLAVDIACGSGQSTSYVSKYITEEDAHGTYLAQFTNELRNEGGEELLVNFDITLAIASR